MRKLLLVITLCATILTMGAVTRYSNASNNFATLDYGFLQSAKIDGKVLTMRNEHLAPTIVQDTTTLPHDDRYCLIASCQNNKPGKSKDGMYWGASLDIQANGDRIDVEISCDNSDMHNDLLSREAQVRVSQIVDGKKSVVKQVAVDKGINAFNGESKLIFDLKGDALKVYAGKKSSEIVLETSVARPHPTSHVGVLLGPDAQLAVRHTLVAFNHETKRKITTEWTMETLTQHFAQSKDPMEGFWEYLDRDMQETWVKMGGRYTLATVGKESGGYDIIYCDGAQVGKAEWQPFMLKGTLEATIFSNTYNATWIDATFEPITEDVQAQVEGDVILTVKFPVLNAQLRFSKRH